MSDMFGRFSKLSPPGIELEPSDRRVISSFVEMRVIHAGGGGALHRKECHFDDVIGSLPAIPSLPTEFAERLKMVTSVHDISDGLLAGDNLFHKTYMLSDSAVVCSF
jgi:hypothetical protein